MMIRKLLLTLFLFLSLCGKAFATDYTADANCKLAWLMEEGAGDTTDDASASGITGNFSSLGNPTWYNTSLPGAFSTWALDFSSDKVTSASAVGVAGLLSAKSYSVWVYADTLNRPIVSTRVHGDSGGYVEKIYINSSGYVGFSHRGSTTTLLSLASNNALSTGTWYHIAVTWDGSNTAANVHIYVNGTEVTYGTQTNGNGLSNVNTYATILGYGADTDTYWDGKIDEFAMFNRELNSTEVNEIMDYGLKGSATARRRMWLQ